MRCTSRQLLRAAIALCLIGPVISAAEPTTGPQTEKRFPPLQLAKGFQATLFACDPLIEYPSVIAPGFKNGTLLVAIDYMTGLGMEIVRRDEIRLLEDTDGDGYADKATVYASGFNSIQGLAQHNGVVFVMHAPYLTALRDTKGTGKADNRRDLITGLGLPPEQDEIRLHNANGVVLGHDGWLYLALGDRGCNVARPEGDKLILEGGGVLRCRADGRDLHVFSRGLRNIYDVALDEELNVLLRDNENDGGAYKVRLCHSFFGADHGYPYLYSERPNEALSPVADLGLGAPAGGVCYLEQHFPAEYHGNLLFCEWGRAVVRSQLKRSGATFGTQVQTDFVAGAANDPYGFKPTDLVIDRDGSLFVSDWCDGQRPKRGRGRIYHIRYVGKDAGKAVENNSGKLTLPELVSRLDSDSYFTRREAQESLEARGKEGLAALKKEKLGVKARLHAVWIMAKIEGRDAVDGLLALAQSDPEPRVQAQALRVVADLTDPVLVKHRLDAGKGDEAIAQRIADLARKDGLDPRVQLEAIIALGRLRWSGAPIFLQKMLKKPEPALAHAAMWTLRHAGNWPAVLKLLDELSSEPIRAIALRAVATQYGNDIVDGLIDLSKRETDSVRRQEYADLLTRVFKKPGPWVYWGFRPAPRPANIFPWERTDNIAKALDDALLKFAPVERAALLSRMVREKVPASATTLASMLRGEHDAERVKNILASMSELPVEVTLDSLELVLRESKHSAGNRLAAASAFLQGLKTEDEKRFLSIAEVIEDGPVLAEFLRAIATRKTNPAESLLIRKTSSSSAEVRIRAAEALAHIGTAKAHPAVEKLFDDPDVRVRAAAVQAAGKLALNSTADRVLKLAGDPATEVRTASLIALRQLGDRRAVPAAVSALGNRESAAAALDYLASFGGADQARAVAEFAQREPSLETLAAVGKVFVACLRRNDLKPGEREQLQQALAKLQGSSGTLLAWRSGGPQSYEDAARLVLMHLTTPATDATAKWPIVLSTDMESRLQLGLTKRADEIWFASTEVELSEVARVEFFSASTGLETIWLNSKQIFERKPGGSARIEADLAKGRNRILVRLSEPKDVAEFQLRFRRKNSAPVQERYAASALSRAGNPGRGREIFMNAEKSQCIKCHRVGDKGERFGPELTGLGSRFSKIHIIESILEPSRTVSPTYESIVVELKSERTLTGLNVEESATTLIVLDPQAKKHILAKSDIESIRKSALSTMPEGIEKNLKEEEFVDLVAFLVSLKIGPGK